MKNLKQLSLIVLATIFFSSCGYNKIVELEEAANTQWGQVESVYERRAALVPQLLNQAKSVGSVTQKYSSDLEKAMGKVASSKTDLTNESQIDSFDKSQKEVGNLISNFLNDLQSHPDFKLYEKNILDLKSQIEGSENRINNERRKYNKTVEEYNAYINKIPQNLTSGLMGFKDKAYFEAKKGAN